MLVYMSAILLINGEQWTSLSSITPQLTVYFNRTPQDINWFSNIFIIVISILATPSVYFPKFIKIKYCLLIGGLLHAIGTLIKLMVSLFPFTSNERFIACIIGTIFPSLSQAFILNIPPYLSKVWFSKGQRNLTTSIAYGSNFLGIAIGFLFPNSLLSLTSYGLEFQTIIKILFGCEFGFSAIVFCSMIFVVIEKPKAPARTNQTDPPESDQKNKKPKVKNLIFSLFGLFKNGKVVLYLIAFGLCYSAPTVFYTFLSEFISLYLKDEPNLTGFSGSVSVLAGALLMFLTGFIITKTGPNVARIISILCFIVTLATLIIMVIMIYTFPFNKSSIFILVVFYGIFSAPYNSIGIELLVTLTQPTQPYVCSTASLIIGNILSCIYIYTLGYLKEFNKIVASIFISIACYIISLMVVSFVKISNDTT
ncbi:hypothetical protein HZS_7141 [Henneguya salminicola]|nr:hypothetical protein HZS_7141 [Henneguya salminicola]